MTKVADALRTEHRSLKLVGTGVFLSAVQVHKLMKQPTNSNGNLSAMNVTFKCMRDIIVKDFPKTTLNRATLRKK